MTVQDEPEKVYVRVRLPKAVYDAVVASSVEAGVPLGSYLAMMVAAAHKALTGDGPGLALPRPRSKSELRRLEVHDKELTAEAADPQETELAPPPPERQTERHWHRITSRKREDAVRVWFDKGDEFGEFCCDCGTTVTRTVQER